MTAGYATGDTRACVAALFPGGHWGRPDAPARLVAWLATDEAAWITGQVITSDGGFGADTADAADAGGHGAHRRRRPATGVRKRA